MKNFLTLPPEKQNKVVTAAMTLFGEVGYKKAYISEIASAAGVSKSLIFHYFGSKKALYSYLVYYTGKIVMTEAQDKKDTLGKDFFDRVITTIKFRLEIKSRYPAMNLFMESVYKEDEPEVSGDIERLLAIATDMHAKVELNMDEIALFKPDVDPLQVVELVDKYTEGVVYLWSDTSNIDKVVAESEKCMKILRENFCR